MPKGSAGSEAAGEAHEKAWRKKLYHEFNDAFVVM